MIGHAMIRRGFVVAGVAALFFGVTVRETFGGGGNVLPPTAQPRGYSLLDMMFADAFFNSSGNDPQYYPNTPFQILFVDQSMTTDMVEGRDLYETGTNQPFVVSPGTIFYVPIASVDDSPPIIGNFPTRPSQAAAYFFGASQIGIRDVEIIVDGQATPIGPAYMPGFVQTPPLPDAPAGEGGTHIMVLGVFLTPLSPGKHTVTLQYSFAGAALAQVTKFRQIHERITYTVLVR